MFTGARDTFPLVLSNHIVHIVRASDLDTKVQLPWFFYNSRPPVNYKVIYLNQD